MQADVSAMTESVESIAHVIQVALTPVFLLTGIASLLSVFSTRLARVADRVDALSEKLETAAPGERPRLQSRLVYLRRRSHLLDGAVIMGALGGGSTCLAAFMLFVGTLRDHSIVSILFICFGFALLCAGAALALFLTEMLLASRGIRDQVAAAGEAVDADDEPDERDGPAADASSMQ